jgi:hypothetical protein
MSGLPDKAVEPQMGLGMREWLRALARFVCIIVIAAALMLAFVLALPWNR